ncbi:MAG: hypothetical protein U1C04_24545 [Hydrogenophaga sp.]|uniref:hypothetical protein n=1 Tax=Hydrogenophaga sp. TaxID=1904254 RepID=UPI002ABCC391|nr:hypothetical protein [Hydrogenophaga sp.]MDZ4283917.1 hypothetical protein [Hydrogenophaga sp.]
MINDPGYWVVQCSGCNEPFYIAGLHDVFDSYGTDIVILAREEGDVREAEHPVAQEVARHNLNLNELSLVYDYYACSLYECACLRPLETPSLQQLEKEMVAVNMQYRYRIHYAIKGRFYCQYVVAKVKFACECGASHEATFYRRFVADPDQPPLKAADFVLADVSGAQLADALDGIRSKDDAMDLLTKLVMRWNLLADQIMIASPFIGHQFLSKEKQMAIWEWLLGMLDPRITVFVSRAASWKAYREAMEKTGLPVDILEQFGLENKVVSAGQAKQDFHAKFYAGISDDWCEVYSGSANLLRGPSMENTSFRRVAREMFNKRYLARLALREPLPEPQSKASERSLLMYQS